MSDKRDICIVHDSGDAHRARRISAVLKHLGFSVYLDKYAEDGGLPRRAHSQAIIACLSESFTPTRKFIEDCDQSSNFPPILVAQFGAALTLRSYEVIENLAKVDMSSEMG